MSVTHRILVAETARYRTLITNVVKRDSRLKSLDIEVVEAQNGVEALDLFEAERPDMVITELLLSRMSGFEVVRKIREDLGGKDVPILVTTALAGDTTSLSLLERRYDVTVQLKPFAPWSLAQTIKKILTRGSGFADKEPTPQPPSAPQRDSRGTGPHRQQPRQDQQPSPAGRERLSRTPSLIDIQLQELDRAHAAAKQAHAGGGRGTGAPQGEAALASAQTQAQAQARRKVTTPGRSGRVRRGDLAEVSLGRLMMDILDQGLSGILTLVQDQVKKVLYFHQGRPVFVQSNLRRETMGMSLVRKGRITPLEHNQALELTRRDQLPYGDALVNLDILTPGEVRDELSANVRFKIVTTLPWQRGSWLFQEDHAVLSRVPRCEIDPVAVAIEGLREKSSAETAMHRMAGREGELVELLPRFERHKDRFVAIFGPRLVELAGDGQPLTAGRLIVGMGSPFEAVLQLDILLKLGMARLVPPGGAAAGDDAGTGVTAGEPGGTEAAVGGEADPEENAKSEESTESGDPEDPEDEVTVREESPLDQVPTEEEVLRAPEGRALRAAAGAGDRGDDALPVAPPLERLNTAELGSGGISQARMVRSFQAGKTPARKLVQSTYLALHHRNHYNLLGLTLDATSEDVEEAYQSLRAQFSADALGEPLDDLVPYLRAIHHALDLAYMTLCDEEARAAYDQELQRSGKG